MPELNQGNLHPFARLLELDRAHTLVTDTALAVVLAGASTPWVNQYAGSDVVLRICNYALVIPLVLRRKAPKAVFLVISAVALVQWLAGEPLVADVALLVALFTVAVESPAWTAAAAAALMELGVVMASLRFHVTDNFTRSFVGLNGLVAAALLLGVVMRVRRDQMAQLTERAARAEAERDTRAQMAAAAERARIAREMHDVIAHSLAVMVTMAEGASSKLRRDPDRAEAAIGSISQVGRAALAETRRLVGVLREPESGTQLAPQPGLGQLPGLVEVLSETGLMAHLEISGEAFEVPQGAQLAVYRVAQEATTNTLKHALGPTRVDITLRYLYPLLEVEVTDDGRRPEPATSTAGHGLAGMAERVGLYRGQVEAGPGTSDGWVVKARMTINEEVQS